MTDDINNDQLPSPKDIDGSIQLSVRANLDDEGMRLDRFICNSLEGITRSRIKELIKTGCILRQDTVISSPNARVKLHDIYEVTLPPAASPEPIAQNIPLDVVYEDEDLIVINKPAGLVVHPATGHWQGTLVNALLYHCGDSLSGIGGVKRPGIVHRLDRQTSGLMVVAKNDAAHNGLSQQFADHGRTGPLVRAYTALVWGTPAPLQGIVHTQIGRSTKNALKMAVVKERGKKAVTHFETVASYGQRRHKAVQLAGKAKTQLRSKGTDDALAAKVICRLETGRTHQIRVHLTHIGHPLIADRLYGTGFKTKAELLPQALKRELTLFSRQALHAHELGFEHPLSGEHLVFTCELPIKMKKIEKFLESL